MGKSTVQTSLSTFLEKVVDEMHSSDRLERKGADVDLGRRRLFTPLRRLKPEASEERILSTKNESMPEHTAAVDDPSQKSVELKDVVVGLIRATSAQSLLVTDKMLLELFEQDVLAISDDGGKVILLEDAVSLDADEKKKIISKAIQELLSGEAFEDIVELVGQKSHYYYSTKSMSSNYAKMLMLVEENDHCTMIAEVVRFESATYPRPYAVEMLQYEPFVMKQEEITAAVAALETCEGCEDILPVRASNDALYLYSSQHMTHAMAKGLCDWIEVEQFETP